MGWSSSWEMQLNRRNESIPNALVCRIPGMPFWIEAVPQHLTENSCIPFSFGASISQRPKKKPKPVGFTERSQYTLHHHSALCWAGGVRRDAGNWERKRCLFHLPVKYDISSKAEQRSTECINFVSAQTGHDLSPTTALGLLGNAVSTQDGWIGVWCIRPGM